MRLVHAADAATAPLRTAAISALCSASLLLGAPSHASTGQLAPALEEAIVEMSRASHPILSSLQPETFQPFTAKVANTLLKISPTKLGQTIDLGLDALNSVPSESVSTFATVVTDAFAPLKTESCTLVPLPPVSLVDQLRASKAAASMDMAKFRAFEDRWGGTYAALSKTESAICLPSVESLEKLALAQAEIGRSIGADEAKR